MSPIVISSTKPVLCINLELYNVYGHKIKSKSQNRMTAMLFISPYIDLGFLNYLFNAKNMLKLSSFLDITNIHAS